MKKNVIFLILFSLSAILSKAQNKNIARQQILADLEFVRKTLNEKSSYAYLNGYDFNKDIENYSRNLKDSTTLQAFGSFLAETIGKIGDRHSSVRDYETTDSLFMPFLFAPEGNKVLVLNRNDKKLALLNTKFPYLKKIDNLNTQDFLQKILPAERSAPKDAYFTKSVREIRDVQKTYDILKIPLPTTIKLTLSDASFQKDTVLLISPVVKSKRSIYWDEKFERAYALTRDEDYNRPEIIEKLFEVKDQIAYIKIPAMVSKSDAPMLFGRLNAFMQTLRNNSKALIVDVRSNGGGTRDLTYELAKYFVHPDSIYVINATRQRATTPLGEEYIESLHARNLHSLSELNTEEQKHATKFLKVFKPMYQLNDQKYSEYYFGIFNGKKLAEKSTFYNKPVYILSNEKSFSAASVFVAAFKGLPNIHIVGTQTDGSSGNSERFELPNSRLRIKLSTMVSFQKDGKILDGFGTEPDIKIERDINQALWECDTQLEKLKSLISKRN